MKNLRPKLLFSICLICLICSGCTTTIGQTLKINYNTRQEYVKNHPDLPPELKDAILKGRVINGMTQSDVLAVWGKPTRIFLERGGESWFYDQPFYSFSPSKAASFNKEGRVYQSSETWK